MHVFSEFGGGNTLDAGTLVAACHASCAVTGILDPVWLQSTANTTEIFEAVDSDGMNPTPQVINEAKRFFPGRKVGVVLSIGAGKPPWNARERGLSEWRAGLDAMETIYTASEAKAQLVSAEQDILGATNYSRFSLGRGAEQVGVDELVDFAQVTKLSGEYCTASTRVIKTLIRSIQLARTQGAERDAIFEENGMEILNAIIHQELLTAKRLLRRSEDLYSRRSPVRIAPSMLLEAALDTEAMAKQVWGEGSPTLQSTVEVTEWVRGYLQTHSQYQPKWNKPADPVKHSRSRAWRNRLQPTLKEKIMALVPCYKTSLEDAHYVLDNFLDVVFVSEDRANWIWNLAQRSDQEVQTGVWLKNVSAESRAISSQVLQLIKTRLSRRFPGGPWSPSPRPSVVPNHEKTQVQPDMLADIMALPERNDEETQKMYDLVRTQYARDNPPGVPPTKGKGLVQGLKRLDPFQKRGKTSPPKAYQYSSLPAGSFTRVIVLRPASLESDELCCDIELVNLGREAYTFDAVSYVWGEPKFTDILRCGSTGDEIRITPTLGSALRRFRSSKTPRRLWADAVCINQSDNEEKARQVAQMALIYQRARSTVIYLGDQLPGQERYVYFLLKLADAVPSIASAVLDMNKNNDHIQRIMLDAFGRENLPAIRNMTKFPWFGRRWIIQEAALCRVVVVFFGRSMLRLDHLQLSMTALANSSFITYGAAQGAMNSLDVIQFIRNYRSRWMEKGSGYGILDLLVNSHFSQATEPRDRLFALLALALDVNRPGEASSGISLRPDYTKYLLETYTDFALQCLRSSPTLDLLHCAGSFRCTLPTSGNPYLDTDGPMGYPSYVPDWTARRRYMPLVDVRRFAAGFGDGAPAARTIRARSLVIRGMVLDYVSKSTEAFPDTLLPDLIPGVIGTSLQVYDSVVPPGSAAAPIPLEAFSRTLIVDNALLDSSIMLKGAPRTPEQDEEERARAERSRKALHMGFQAIHADYKATGAKNMNFLKVQNGDGKNFLQLQYAKAICQTMEGRSFFMSERRFMGVGPDDIREKDLIVVFFGVRTPFVLRPVPFYGAGAYKIVGDCYVDGFMYGEALKIPSAELAAKTWDFRIQ